MNSLLLALVVFVVVLFESDARIFLSSTANRAMRRMDQAGKGIPRHEALFLRGGASKDKGKRKKKREGSVESTAAEAEKPVVQNSADNSEEASEEDNVEEDLQVREPSKSTQMFASMREVWDRTPPLTQAYVGGSVVITLLSALLNKNKWPSFLHFEWKSIVFGLQVWRVLSAFLYLGPLDIFFPLTIQFVWQHMGQLEKLNSQNPEDFFLMTIFGCVALIAAYAMLGVSTKFLGHNLATYFVYIWARVFEGTDVNFMDLFTLKAEMLPWFFCAQTYLLEGELPIADLIGIAVGHVYHYLTSKQLLVVPTTVKQWFSLPSVRSRYSRFKDELM